MTIYQVRIYHVPGDVWNWNVVRIETVSEVETVATSGSETTGASAVASAEIALAEITCMTGGV